MINHLASEESFKKFVNGLCCNGCRWFVKDQCIEADHEAHDVDKAWTVQAGMNEYLHATNEQAKENHKEFIDHINNYYLCLQFKSRNE